MAHRGWKADGQVSILQGWIAANSPIMRGPLFSLDVSARIDRHGSLAFTEKSIKQVNVT